MQKQKFNIGTTVVPSAFAPQSRRFNGTRKIRSYFYDATSEHVWYGVSVNGQVVDLRSDWLTEIY
jgi:hypothetical protein